MTPGGWVIDCSAVLALLLDEDEGNAIESLVREVIAGGQSLVVPALFWFEAANALAMGLRRGRLKPEEVRVAEAALSQLPFLTEPPPDSAARQRIRELALAHGLSAYDAAYVECAERLGCGLKTLDRDLLALRRKFRFIQ